MRAMTRGTTRTAAALGLLAGTGLVLTGCSSPEDQAEGAVEDLIENAIGEDSDLDLGMTESAELPDTWPSDLPQPGGHIDIAYEQEGGGYASFSGDTMSAEDYVAELESAGWTEDNAMAAGDNAYLAVKGDWGAVVSWGTADDSITVIYTPRDQDIEGVIQGDGDEDTDSADGSVEDDSTDEADGSGDGGFASSDVDEWPDSLPLPPGATTEPHVSFGVGAVEFDTTEEEILGYADELESAGFTRLDELLIEGLGNISFERDNMTVVVGWGIADGAARGTVSLIVEG